MKRTQRKDSLRNIKKQWVSFLSIVVIATLGITAFLGLDYTTAGIRKSAATYYHQQNFRDIEVVSTLLFSEDDLNSLKKIKGVADVEATRYVEATATFGAFSGDVGVLSLTERINQAELLEGRLPTDATECAIEKILANDSGIRVGDQITLADTNGQQMEYLNGKKFVVTGIVNHPDHINLLVVNAPYVVVPVDAFNAEALSNCFMKAEIIIEKAAGIDLFSKEYRAEVEDILARIDALALSATKSRDKTIVDGATAQLNAGKELVEDGFDQIEAAKAAIRTRLQSTYNRIFQEDADRELLHWATVRKADVDDPNETARYFWITENIRVDMSRPLDEILEAIAYSKSIPDNFLVVLYEVTQEKEAPTIGKAYDMESIRKTLIEESAKEGEAYTQLSEACLAWDAGHEQYLEGKAQYDKAMAELQPCRWLSYGVNGNASFVQLTVASGTFHNLESTFSAFFIAVGALVIFATVGKMVDEQRTLVGATKALGFFNREIFGKYLAFGLSATLLGTLLGALTARFGIAPFLLNGFQSYYSIALQARPVTILPTVLAVLAGALLAVASILLACSRLLREPATRLMQPPMPGVKKKKGKEKRLRALSLYSRLILLNMRMDLKRVIVTIVSVAGCCALIVIGVTLRSSTGGAVVKQYNDIVHYDLCVYYDPQASDTAQSDTEAILKSNGTQFTNLYISNITYSINDLQLGELYCGEIDEIGKYFSLNDWKTGKALHSTGRGVYIQRRMAEVYSLDVGSEFEIAIGGTQTAIVRVAGVFENYIGRNLVMSREYYETLYGKEPVSNAFMVRLAGANEQSLVKALDKVAGFTGITRADADRSIIENSTSMTNAIVLIFIFIAALMAGIVQSNLTNMYILQKKRELTIMRVNGFSTREVIAYMLRETFLTTVVGILLGVLSGIGFAYRIVRTIEQSFLQFDRTPNLWACVIAVLITVLFTVIVNFFALRKVKYLKLTDVA